MIDGDVVDGDIDFEICQICGKANLTIYHQGDYLSVTRCTDLIIVNKMRVCENDPVCIKKAKLKVFL